jgi:hypothetical protein
MTPIFLILPRNEPLYLRRVVLQCFARGEAPFCAMESYGLALTLQEKQERDMAVQASVAWLELVPGVVCYVDMGVTREMKDDLERAKRRGKQISFRRLVGGVTVEAFHFQGVAHDEDQCAICRGPKLLAELTEEQRQRLRTTGTIDE